MWEAINSFFDNSRQSGLGRAPYGPDHGRWHPVNCPDLDFFRYEDSPLALKWMFKTKKKATVRFPALQLYVQH